MRIDGHDEAKSCFSEFSKAAKDVASSVSCLALFNR
jgi:diacylglycerol kinase